MLIFAAPALSTNVYNIYAHDTSLLTILYIHVSQYDIVLQNCEGIMMASETIKHSSISSEIQLYSNFSTHFTHTHIHAHTHMFICMALNCVFVSLWSPLCQKSLPTIFSHSSDLLKMPGQLSYWMFYILDLSDYSLRNKMRNLFLYSQYFL